MAKKPVDKTVDLNKLAELAKGFTGADIAALVNAAAISAIKEYITVNRNETNNKKLENGIHASNNDKKKVPLTISMNHFDTALKKIKRNPQVQPINR
jgi:transitional endoplasmic reticulum ATPase